MQTSSHTPAPVNEQQIVKIIYFSMFGAAFLYLYVLQMVAPPQDPQLAPVMKQALWGLAAVMAGAVIYFRKAKIMPILERPVAAAALRSRLKTSYIIAFALSEAVVLYGFVLRMLGSTLLEAAVPYTAGLILFVINYPRWPAGEPAP